jgi:hypothetical protein
MPDSQPVLYDRAFSFHPGFTLLMIFSLACVLGAFMAPWLTGKVMEPQERLATEVGSGAVALVVLGIFGLMWRMQVTLTPVELIITWGYLGVLRSRFPLDSVTAYRVVTFSPLRDFGGWGWRKGRDGRRCYNTRGNTGVELTIGGKGYIIGVSDPEELAQALRLATRKKAGS